MRHVRRIEEGARLSASKEVQGSLGNTCYKALAYMSVVCGDSPGVGALRARGRQPSSRVAVQLLPATDATRFVCPCVPD